MVEFQPLCPATWGGGRMFCFLPCTPGTSSLLIATRRGLWPRGGSGTLNLRSPWMKGMGRGVQRAPRQGAGGGGKLAKLGVFPPLTSA